MLISWLEFTLRDFSRRKKVNMQRSKVSEEGHTLLVTSVLVCILHCLTETFSMVNHQNPTVDKLYIAQKSRWTDFFSSITVNCSVVWGICIFFQWSEDKKIRRRKWWQLWLLPTDVQCNKCILYKRGIVACKCRQEIKAVSVQMCFPYFESLITFPFF